MPGFKGQPDSPVRVSASEVPACFTTLKIPGP